MSVCGQWEPKVLGDAAKLFRNEDRIYKVYYQGGALWLRNERMIKMSNIVRDENKIYQVIYGKDGWIWARFDVKQWQYLAYVDLDDAILCKYHDSGISSNWLYQVITKGDLVIGYVTVPC